MSVIYDLVAEQALEGSPGGCRHDGWACLPRLLEPPAQGRRLRV